MKGVIVYKGKYGATQQYAAWLGEELHLPVYTAHDPTIENISAYDFVVAGGSVYMGKLQIKNWLLEHELLLQQKKMFLFIVCGTPASEKEKLEKIVRENLPASLVGSCTVYFLPGRVIHQQLSWRDNMMLKLGAMLTKNPRDKKNMLKEFDLVKKEYTGTLVAAVKSLPVEKTETVLSKQQV